MVGEHDNWTPPPMAGQLELGEIAVEESVPKARVSDPETSHAAAASVKMRAGSSKAVLLLAHYDCLTGLTDEEAAERAGVSLASEYATRCSELRRLGLLAEHRERGGELCTRIGRAGERRIISGITQHGIDYVTGHGWRTIAH